MQALAVSQHNKVKTVTDRAELAVIERLRMESGQLRYVFYPWWDVLSEGLVYESKNRLQSALLQEGISLYDERWLPIEEAFIAGTGKL